MIEGSSLCVSWNELTRMYSIKSAPAVGMRANTAAGSTAHRQVMPHQITNNDHHNAERGGVINLRREIPTRKSITAAAAPANHVRVVSFSPPPTTEMKSKGTTNPNIP